jgi:hypothetical protein
MFIIVPALIVVGVGTLFAMQGYAVRHIEQASKTVSQKTTITKNKAKETTSSPSDTVNPAPAADASQPQASTPPVSSTMNRPSAPAISTAPSSQSPVNRPFAVSYVGLDQPAVYCSGGGDYYIAQIGDFPISLNGNTGGEITYGFEVTGGIPDNWNGYRQKATVPAGSYSTSFNKLYWGSGSDPHMAYSETLWAGHGAATIRAVVYTPNLVYSPSVTVPAQGFGEKCM